MSSSSNSDKHPNKSTHITTAQIILFWHCFMFFLEVALQGMICMLGGLGGWLHDLHSCIGRVCVCAVLVCTTCMGLYDALGGLHRVSVYYRL